MFDAAGLAYPTTEWTWDDYEEAAKALTVTDGSKTTQWGTDALSFGGIWYALAGQAGDEVVKDGKLALGSDTFSYLNLLLFFLCICPKDLINLCSLISSVLPYFLYSSEGRDSTVKIPQILLPLHFH